MVVNQYLQCEACHAKYKLKVQMDYSYGQYDWPVAIYCPDCGNIIKCTINKHGLQPESCKCDVELQDYVYLLGYSAQLPISPGIFYDYMKDIETIGTLTPFMALFESAMDIKKHESNIQALLDNIFPWRSFLTRMLPIYIHGNVDAFVNIIKIIFGVTPEGLNSIRDCELRIFQQLGSVYNNLTSFNRYKQSVAKKRFATLSQFMQNATPEVKNKIKTSVDSGLDTDAWLKTEALVFIAKMVEGIEKIFPAMLYASCGDFTLPHDSPLYIATIDYREANALYQEGAETLDHIIPLIAAIQNEINNGNPDLFQNPLMKGQNSISDLCKLSMGAKLDKLADYAELQEFIGGCLNGQIRNGIAHNGVSYSYNTQVISYHFDQRNPDLHYDERLIDITFRCYLLLVKVLESVHILSFLR